MVGSKYPILPPSDIIRAFRISEICKRYEFADSCTSKLNAILQSFENFITNIHKLTILLMPFKGVQRSAWLIGALIIIYRGLLVCTVTDCYPYNSYITFLSSFHQEW